MPSFTSGGHRIEVEWFAASRGSAAAGGVTGAKEPALLLLHGANGLTCAEGYRLAARSISALGYHGAFVHNLDRSGDRRAAYSRLRHSFPIWAATVRDAVTWLPSQPIGGPICDPNPFGSNPFVGSHRTDPQRACPPGRPSRASTSEPPANCGRDGSNPSRLSRAVTSRRAPSKALSKSGALRKVRLKNASPK